MNTRKVLLIFVASLFSISKISFSQDKAEKIDFETNRLKTSVKAGMDTYKESRNSSSKNLM